MSLLDNGYHSCMWDEEMSIRKIIKIDEDKCDGCGECIINCPEGALQIVDGKARLVKESYCDGLGVCIGKCPVGAITIEEREAEGFDEEAVKKHMERANAASVERAATCPGSAVRQMAPPGEGCPGSQLRQRLPSGSCPTSMVEGLTSQLSHWPVQLTLVPPTAPFLQNADVLLVADCVPFAFADFHQRFLQGGHPVLVGCPKLDDTRPYIEKLTAMVKQSSLHSLTIVHMEVPCCSGLCRIVKEALKSSGASLPVKDVTVGIDGKIISEKQW